MKKLSFIVTATFILCFFFSYVYADSASVTPSGTATQPDVDMQGSDILNAGTVGTGDITATTGNITNHTSNQITTNTANIGNAAVAGTMSVGRARVSRAPTAWNDLTNRIYVDSLTAMIQSQINSLKASVTAVENRPPPVPYCIPGWTWSPPHGRCIFINPCPPGSIYFVGGPGGYTCESPP